MKESSVVIGTPDDWGDLALSKYNSWNQFFQKLEGTEKTLTFEELERLINGNLPGSAYEHQPWWSNTQYHAVWAKYGWSASPNMRLKTVGFKKTGAHRQFEQNTTTSIPHPKRNSATGGGPSQIRLILLGCVSEKRKESAPAKDLYISPLWEKRRHYAEASGQPWAILSAEYGFVKPDDVLSLYDRSLKNETAFYRKNWSKVVLRDVLEFCNHLKVSNVEVHAGKAYIESGLMDGLIQSGILVDWPLQGMRIGEQLSWYGRLEANDRAANQPKSSDDGSHPDDQFRSVPKILTAKLIGPFEYKWPVNIESFVMGWEGEAEVDGEQISFRHGLGGRFVFGTHRVHTVTWLEGAPMVEGVAADDYSNSRALVSRLKRTDGKMAKTKEDIAAEYSSFLVVDHQSEVNAKYSPKGLGVKIREDDVASWVHHAVLRLHGKNQAFSSPGKRKSKSASGVALSGSTIQAEAISTSRKLAVARAIVGFAPEAANIAGDLEGESFANDPNANQLLRDDALAFLFAVIADYQVPAERAWALPYLLKQRLGHLDPERMLNEPEKVSEAIARSPALHRYVNKVPSFIVDACSIVLTQYGGDASQIWGGDATAFEVQRRLKAFPGISQKKAAMAVEILERDFDVPIKEMSGSDVAYDVHIRRVFLRSGLAEMDDVNHMVLVARETWPERPGLLDLPSWVIGRTWCRPKNPDCMECAIVGECAQRISAADSVQGA